MRVKYIIIGIFICLMSCENESDDPIQTNFDEGYIEFEIKGNYFENNIDIDGRYTFYQSYDESEIVQSNRVKHIDFTRYSNDFNNYITVSFLLDSANNYRESLLLNGVIFKFLITNEDHTFFEIGSRIPLLGTKPPWGFDDIHYDELSNSVTGSFYNNYDNDSTHNYTLNGEFNIPLYKIIR